jgi:1,4-alpha-glucan branching enzyme
MQFLLLAPDADSVKVVGEFNDWDDTQHAMAPSSAKGAWTTTVPLTPGRYEYQFLVYTRTGVRRIHDPSAPRAPSEFGSSNSIVTVSPGQ